MGYRSDVTIVVKKNVTPESLEDVATTYPFVHFMSEDDWNLYHFDWIKWYDTCKEIKMIMDDLSRLDSQDYFFMRLGEDVNDYEESGDAHDAVDFPFTVSPVHQGVYTTLTFDSEMHRLLQSILRDEEWENGNPVLLNMLKDFIANNPKLFA